MLQMQIVQLPTGDWYEDVWRRQVVAYREVKNKRKLQTVISKSGRCRLREVPTVVIWLGKFWYFGTVVACER